MGNYHKKQMPLILIEMILFIAIIVVRYLTALFVFLLEIEETSPSVKSIPL